MDNDRAGAVDELLARIKGALPMQVAAVERAAAGLTAEELEELGAYVGFCRSEGLDIDRLVKAYKLICEDTLREQIHFRRHGRYRNSTFAEVAGSVYFDAEYMSDYMYGLALTQFLWPNHREIFRYFERMLDHVKPGRYLEVGPGHGAFFKLAIRTGKFDYSLGVDISPTSLAICRKLLTATEIPTSSWELVEQDFLELSGEAGTFDTIVMGEVLEHVEKPGAFLDKVHELAVPGGFAFVTTAINAPAVDHIYLFRSVDEVRDMAIASGFIVEDFLATPYPGSTMEESEAMKLPVNIALALRK